MRDGGRTHAGHGASEPSMTRSAAARASGSCRRRYELFTERGFHGTAMPLVAERAGVAAGTIYRYFDSKEALVDAVFQKLEG